MAIHKIDFRIHSGSRQTWKAG